MSFDFSQILERDEDRREGGPALMKWLCEYKSVYWSSEGPPPCETHFDCSEVAKPIPSLSGTRELR